MERFDGENQLSEMEEEMIENLFQRCDTNGEGHVHVQTVINFLKNCLGNGNNEPDLVKLTDILEAGSHSGHISLGKYREGLKKWILKIRARCDSTSILDTDGMLNTSFDPDISTGLSNCLESSGLADGSCEKRIDVGEMLSQIEALKHQNQRLSEENGQLHVQLESQEEVVSSLTADIHTKQQTEEHSRKKMKSLQDMLDLRNNVMEDNEELKQKLWHMQESKKELDAQLVSMERDNTDLQAQLTHVEDSWQRAASDLESTNRELQTSQTANLDLKSQLFQVQEVKASADDVINQKCGEIENLKQKLQDFTKEHEKLKEEKSSVSTKLSELSCQLKRYQRGGDSCLLPEGDEDPIVSKLFSPKSLINRSLNRHSICMELKDRLNEDKHLPSPLCEKVELLSRQRPVMLPTYMASWDLDDSMEQQSNISLELMKKPSPQSGNQVDIEKKLSSVKDLDQGALQREIIRLYRVNVELSEKCHTAERKEVELTEELRCLKETEQKWSKTEDAGLSYEVALEEDLKDLWRLVHNMTGEEETEIDDAPVSCSTFYLRQQIKEEIAQLKFKFHGRKPDAVTGTPRFSYYPGATNTSPLVDALNLDCFRQARSTIKPPKLRSGTDGHKKPGKRLSLPPLAMFNQRSVPLPRHATRVHTADQEHAVEGEEGPKPPDRKDIPKWFVYDSTSEEGRVNAVCFQGEQKGSLQGTHKGADLLQISDVIGEDSQLSTGGHLLRRLSYTTAIENQTSPMEDIPRTRSDSFQAAIEQGRIGSDSQDDSIPLEQSSKHMCWSRAPRLSSTPLQFCKFEGTKRDNYPRRDNDQCPQVSDADTPKAEQDPCLSLHEEFMKAKGLSDKGECMSQQLSILLEEDASGLQSPFLSSDSTTSSHQISSIVGSIDSTHSGDTPSTYSLQNTSDTQSLCDRSDSEDTSGTKESVKVTSPEQQQRQQYSHSGHTDPPGKQNGYKRTEETDGSKLCYEEDSYQVQEIEEEEEEDEEFSHEVWTISRSPTDALRDSGHSSSVGSLEVFESHETSSSSSLNHSSCMDSVDKGLPRTDLAAISVDPTNTDKQIISQIQNGKPVAMQQPSYSKRTAVVPKTYIRTAKLNFSLPARFSQTSDFEPCLDTGVTGERDICAADRYCQARNLSPSERILIVKTVQNQDVQRPIVDSTKSSCDIDPSLLTDSKSTGRDSDNFACEVITSQFEKSCAIYDSSKESSVESAKNVSDSAKGAGNVNNDDLSKDVNISDGSKCGVMDVGVLFKPVDLSAQSLHSPARPQYAGASSRTRETTLAPLLEISPIPSPPLSPRINFRMEPDVRTDTHTQEGIRPHQVDMAESSSPTTSSVEAGQGDGGHTSDGQASGPGAKIYQTLSKIRQNHLARRRDQLNQNKMPQLSELAEKDGGEETGEVTESVKQNGDVPLTNGNDPDILPHIPDEFLHKLGLSADEEDSENSDELSEQEIESKFSSLSLAFKTDSQTLEKRLEIQERARDIAEQNVDKELQALRSYLTTLNKICTDPQVRDVLSKIQSHLDVLEKSTARVSSRAEVFGAIQQEKRMSKAVDIMVHHVENIRRVHEREHAELEEARKLLQDSRSLAPSTISDLSAGGEIFNKRSVSVCPNNMGGKLSHIGSGSLPGGVTPSTMKAIKLLKATTRRRVSEIALPKVLGGAGVSNLHPSASMDVIYTEPRSPRFNSPIRANSLWDEEEAGTINTMLLHDPDSSRNLDKDARTRFQSAVASATLKSAVANTMRRASLEKQNNVQTVSPGHTPPHVSRDNSADSAKLSEQDREKQKNLEEEAFKKGYEQGMRASLGQDLSSLREQQNRINENLGAVMDTIDNESEEPKTLKEILLQHYNDTVPKMTFSSWQIRLTFGCFFFLMAFLSVIMSLFPVASGETLTYQNCKNPYL